MRCGKRAGRGRLRAGGEQLESRKVLCMLGDGKRPSFQHKNPVIEGLQRVLRDAARSKPLAAEKQILRQGEAKGATANNDRIEWSTGCRFSKRVTYEVTQNVTGEDRFRGGNSHRALLLSLYKSPC